MENATQVLESLVPLLTRWGLQVIGALAVLIVGRLLAGFVRSAVVKAMKRAETDATLVPFASSMVYYFLIALVLIAVLGIFGIPTASFVAVLGAAGLAVGLALQGTLGNFAAGVMLLVFRPFRVGDAVEISGTIGSVTAIRVFSTTLNTPDNVVVIIPNATVWGQTIKNFSINDNRRIDMVVGVSYDDDLGKAMDIIRRVVTDDERVLKDPEPLIAVSEMADSSVNMVVRPWCIRQDYWALRWELTRRLKEELEAGGCSIPYPQRDVHLLQAAGGEG